MTKKINWRLKGLPTTEELRELVKDQILTKDEAREILFSQETEEDRDKKSLESEIKFLRELVEKLSQGKQSTIIETIRYVEKPYIHYPWYQPYQVWCSTSGGLQGTVTNVALGQSNLIYSAQATSNSLNATQNFSSINTF